MAAHALAAFGARAQAAPERIVVVAAPRGAGVAASNVVVVVGVAPQLSGFAKHEK